MKTIFTVLGLLFCMTAQAAPPPIVWGSPYAKLLTKGIQTSGSDTTTTCVTALAGSIRYNAGTFEGCDGSTWAAFGAAGGGVTTMGAVGATPSANGASISGVTLTLQPASATLPGVVIAGAQSFGAPKTITSSATTGLDLLTLTSSGATGAQTNLQIANSSVSTSAQGMKITMSGATGQTYGQWTQQASSDAGAVAAYFVNGAATTGYAVNIDHSGATGAALKAVTTGTGNKTAIMLSNKVTAANNSGTRLGFLNNRTGTTDTDIAGIVGIITDITAGAYLGALSFQTANNAAPAEQMRIDHAGSVKFNAYTTAGVIINSATGVLTSVAPSTSGNVLTSNGTAWTSAAAAGGSATTNGKYTANMGIDTSVGSSALTIKLVQADGATDPSTGSAAVDIAFRSATSATGSYAIVSRTSALSVVVPSGATLGMASATASYIWVYSISDSGMDLCVSVGDPFDENTVQTGTAIDTASDVLNTLYCGSAHTSKPIRLIGRLLITESTTGTWASDSTTISLLPIPSVVATSWGACGAGVASQWSTNTTLTSKCRRNGEMREIQLAVLLSGAPDSNFLNFTLPTGDVWDSAKAALAGQPNAGEGMCQDAGTKAWQATPLIQDTTHIYIITPSSGLVTEAVPFAFGNADNCTFTVRFPKLGWMTFGP